MSNKANRKRTKSNVVDASIPRLELQVSNSNTMDINDSIDGRTSTISTVSYSRKSTLRSVDEYRGKSVEIAMSIKILTLFYLLLIFLFSFISFIMRILMVFYDYKIDCLIREHSIEIALLGRICLFIIFSYRLYFSFKETSLAYPTPYLILFTLIGFIITNSTLIYFFMQIAKNRDYNTSNYACTKPGFSTTKAILPYFLCEFTFNGILVFLFCRKLIQSIRLLLHLSVCCVLCSMFYVLSIYLIYKLYSGWWCSNEFSSITNHEITVKNDTINVSYIYFNIINSKLNDIIFIISMCIIG